MSHVIQRETYNCGMDHSQSEPCTGHLMEVDHCCSSDTVDIRIDGESRMIITDGAWCALARIVERRGK